jgi:hypothetical protein
MGRAIQDKQLTSVTAFPAAAGNNNSASFDLGARGNAGKSNPDELCEVLISWPILAALVDAKNVVFTLQDSADNSSFAASNPAIAKTITGAGGIGVAAGSVKFRLPAGVRQFVRVNAAEDAAGGTITGSSYTVQLLF